MDTAYEPGTQLMFVKFGTKMHGGTRRKETTPVLHPEVLLYLLFSGFTGLVLHHGLKVKPVKYVLLLGLLLIC